ncbi:MAG: hypothetical protein KA152_17495 [Verrucomicrobiales bacterium]|nr:hypothetical protein [Verrucomicrobiales bacterium]HQW29470.1 hypothetical protein [Verrucomicrobiales bacterium]
MQTTLRINDDTYRRAKAKSSELGLSLTRFFEEAVEERLASLDQRSVKPIVLPVSSVSGPPLSDEELRRRIAAADLEYDLTKVG